MLGEDYGGTTVVPGLREIASAPRARRTTTRPLASVGTSAFRALVLVAVVALTVWNVTRSEALADAKAAYNRRDLVRSLRRALDHLDRQPWSREAALLAARCLSERAFPEQAEPYYRWASRLGALGRDDLHLRAFGLLRRTNQRLRAITAYEELLRRWPDDATALRRLAGAYYAERQLTPALDNAQRLSRTPEGAEAGYALLGTIHHELGNPREAIDAYEKVLALDPELRSMPLDSGLFWRELTTNLVGVGRAADARRLLLDLLTRRDDASIHHALGQAEESLGATSEAEACWRRALDRDPKLVDPWRSLGRLELKKRNPHTAVVYLNRAVEISPDDYETLYSMSLALRQLGRVQEAQVFANKCARIRAKPKAAGSHQSHPTTGQ